MLTVDFDRFPIQPGEQVLDLGCGFGRHAFEAYRRGAHVVAVDRSAEELEQVSGLFASAEVAVVPSLYEGFSIPAVEAMACETPLVATRAGALPEVVGDCAVLVPPGNAADLAAGLADLLDDEPRRRALGAAGRRRVEELFTWRAVAVATADVYRSAIEEFHADR